MYRTAPPGRSGGHQKGDFYHDGRFATLPDVIEHYDGFFKLGLSDQEKRDLSEYLKSLVKVRQPVEERRDYLAGISLDSLLYKLWKP